MSSDTAQRLQAYKDAEAKVLNGQEVRFGGRSLRMADLSEIRAAIDQLESQLAVQQNRAARRGPRRFGVAHLPDPYCDGEG
ncbi:hypothetical protein [Algiphilus sp.]|uniref:hypothetical protein n=1 Tax=Algiphilus sp. TaxID=1872431 RepID=UPI0025C12E50|nr:hypothetical protein [Algiphilus sp.]MCK5770930.1 hypothetical protein [Algiphilus sp.]